jgi:hypothetical protein
MDKKKEDVFLSEEEKQKLINVIMSGGAQLPSRDIPMDTNDLSNEIKPNFIPPPPQHLTKYIQEEEINENVEINKQNHSLWNWLFEKSQIPLLFGILFFMFELPIIKLYLYKYIPILFSNDGHFNIYGYSFYTLLFSLSSYFLILLIY